jgi:hypothetical protein
MAGHLGVCFHSSRTYLHLVGNGNGEGRYPGEHLPAYSVGKPSAVEGISSEYGIESNGWTVEKKPVESMYACFLAGFIYYAKSFEAVLADFEK